MSARPEAPWDMRVGAWADLRDLAYPLRLAVFVHEQGVPESLEQDEHDDAAVHAVVVQARVALATGRLLPDGHIGRLAVRRDARGQGVGSVVLLQLMSEAKVRGDAGVVLNAQLQAVAFYRRHGFVPRGAVFLDAGIEHVEMVRDFNDAGVDGARCRAQTKNPPRRV